MKTQRRIALAVALALVALAALACGGGNSTPTKAFQTFYQAVKNKDVKAFKSIMPQETLARGEQMAKGQNKSVDDMIKLMFDNLPKMPDKAPEYKNENISSDGKTATLEVKDPDTERWGTIRFLKEDDGWKIDFNSLRG